MKPHLYTIRSGNGLIGLLGVVLFFVALYYVLKFSFIALYYAAPVLLIITLLINYRVVTDYISNLWTRMVQNPVAGVFNIVLSVLGAPVVILFLFGKALLFRQISQFQSQFQQQYNQNFTPPSTSSSAKRPLKGSDDFVEYEEVE
jgi:Na+-transporting methylmalonyl-CoA/oxaloacetate decarboxylase gamma subunit